jgi:MFS family permease
LLNNIKTFNSLTIPQYRIYFTGMFGQWLSLSMQVVSQTFLVYYLTDSAAILGFTALAAGLPQFLLLLFGGAFADRFQKKRLLQISQLGQALSSLIVLLALMTGYLSKSNPGCWWVLIITSILSGIFNGLSLPVRQAILPDIVGRERLMNAVALSSLGQNMCTLIGPSVAGFLIAGVGFESVYATMVGLYLIAVVLTNFLPVDGTTIVHRNNNTLRDVREGLKYVFSNRTILLVILFNLVCYVVAIPRLQVMPIFAIDILNVGAQGQGILQSLCAAGSLISALTYATLPPKNRGLMMLVAGLILGLSIMVFAFSRSYALSIVMVIIIGIGQTGHGSMGSILVQHLADREHLGRALSIFQMCNAFASLATFLVGIIVQFAGAPWTVGILGSVLVLTSLASLLFLTGLRKLD